MGTPGVPWNPTKDDIAAALKKSGGVVRQTAKFFNVSRTALYEKINLYPELKEYIAELRNEYVEEVLDESEAVLKGLLKSKDPHIVFKAAIYNLNNLGKKRGYNHPRAIDSQASSLLDEILDG